MKIRTDFVSNSSSSSFILAGDKGSFAAKFKLSKKDFVDAIIDLSGGKEKYDKYVAEHKCKWWNGSWFEVYDKKLAKDKKELQGNGFDYLKGWNSGIVAHNSKGKVFKDHGYMLSKWDSTYRALSDAYKLPWQYEFDAKTNYIDIYDKKTGKWRKKAVPKYIDKIVRELHDYFGVMSNYDVLMCDFARFLFHFGDNDIWCLAGTTTLDKNDDKFDGDSETNIKRNNDIDNSIYETESYTIKRVCEVLFNWFKSHGKLVGLKNETWKDLYNDILAATMHEG